MSIPPPGVAPHGRRRTNVLKAIALAVVIAALLIGGRSAARYVPMFAERVEALGAWGPVVFIVGYVVATVAFVPGAVLTLAAGAIFGLARGTAYVLVGATLGASAAFLVGRYLARSFVERRIARNPRFAALDRAVGGQGRKIIFLLRLSPVVPFNVLNYALGITRVRFVDFLAASVGMLPGTLLYVYYGTVAGAVAAASVRGAPPRSAVSYAVLALGLVATVVVTTVLARIAKRALGRQQSEPGESPGRVAPAIPD